MPLRLLTMNSRKSLKLHVGNAILGAFWIVWNQRLTFVRAVAVPMFFVVALMVVWHETYESLPSEYNYLVWIGYAFLFVLIAVKCHRIVLLAQHVGSAWTLPAWSRRETRFVAWGMVAWVAAILAFMFATTVTLTITANLPGVAQTGDGERMKYVQYAGQLVYWYVFARFCLMFPAIAIDEKTNLRQAWESSRGNGWRLFAVICVPPYCISLFIGFLYRSEATLIEYLLLTAVGTLFLAVEIAALSLSYQQLASKKEGE